MSHKLATSNCFWPTGCADMGRCNAEGFCIARWQAEHKQEIWPVKHGGTAPSIPQIDERTQIYSPNDVDALIVMAIEKCARKCSEYEEYHWKLYQANPNSQQAWDHQTRANAAANCETAILALRSQFLPQLSANPSATKGTGASEHVRAIEQIIMEKDNQMSDKPDSLENLPERLRMLFDKTADAHSNEDYPERVTAGLMAVYTYGVRQGRLITDALSCTSSSTPAKP